MTAIEYSNIHKPFIQKINFWIKYKEESPKVTCKEDKENHDSYRAKNDLDCILLNGNLKADTIVSLWTPMIETIKSFHGKMKPFKSLEQLEEIKKYIDWYLPEEEESVQTLSKLFEVGMTKANVMELPHRAINTLRFQKTHDYMPAFLHLCFEENALDQPPDKLTFRDYFGSDAALIQWIKKESLEVFFKDEIIKQENVLNLSGGENVFVRKSDNIHDLNCKYLEILTKRKEKLRLKGDL